MKINLHIERLVLDGLPIDHHDAPLVQAAVETELTRLLVAEEPKFSSGGATPRVIAPEVNVMNGGPTRVGEEIAWAIHRGIRQ
jgi:hypothetical protein